MIRMRPGVPWNVKGIEAEAREAAQLAARRAGVSLGDYLTQLIMTEGRAGGAQPGYQQGYHQAYQPGDGTYGPQPQPQFQPPPPSNMRFPQAVPAQGYPQGQPQAYQQAYPQPGIGQPRDALTGAMQSLDSQMRGGEFAVVAHGLRDLADRLENSERRAQQAIATVNQSVAAIQDRIDAAERVKQLADVAFSSAADALAQSARDQGAAFESLESTVRSVQKRLTEVESGNAELPGKDAVAKLETALGQLQKRLGEMESLKPDQQYKDAVGRLEVTLDQLQKRLVEMEKAKGDLPQKDALTRLENWINDVRHDVADSEKRSREDMSQIAKYMRELGSRVDAAERNTTQSGGGAARLDALEARSTSMFDEMRGQLAQIDGRLAQTSASAKGGVQAEEFAALKDAVEGLGERFEVVDALSERLEAVSDPKNGPLAGTVGAMESTLETLTTKLEEGERRAADSVSTVSDALQAISTRLDDADKKQSQALHTITRRLDDSERVASESARAVEDSLKSLSQRLEASDKKHKEAMGGLRLTVDGLVAKAAAEALPIGAHAGRSGAPSALSSSQSFPPAPPFGPAPSALDDPSAFPPFSSTAARALSDAPPPPPSFDEEQPSKQDDGFSVSALQTIMSGTLSAPPPPSDLPEVEEPEAFEPEHFEPENEEQSDEFGGAQRKDDFLAQARRAAKAAAAADAERAQHKKRPGYLSAKDDAQSGKLGRLMIIGVAGLALVAGIVALFFTFPSGSDEGINRPEPGASIGEILNGSDASARSETSNGASAEAAAEFEPPTAPDSAEPNADSVAVEPNGLGVPTSESEAPSFTSGTSALPGGSSSGVDPNIAALEEGAVRGDAKAQFVLALRYAEGRSVDKDDVKAASLVTKAAQQGLVVAEYRLGAIYERGIGVQKSLPQAKVWYEKAAKGGNRKAMHNLAVLYADGVGIGQNFQEASRWFREGAERGLADSQYNLAILLERGMGVEKNVADAAKWYAIAASQGDSGAAERLDALKRQMAAGDVAIALDAARKFEPKPLDPVANEVPSVGG
jgi:localization factor PodJL